MEEHPLVPRKEREKQARYQEILNAARELFLENGFADTTLDHIARKAEFGKGTIYNYFANKEELFHAIVDQMLAEAHIMAESSVAGASENDARSALMAYARVLLSHAQANSKFLSLILREMPPFSSPEQKENMKRRSIGAQKKIWQVLAKPIERDIASGKIRPIDPITLAQLFDGMIKFHCAARFAVDQSAEALDVEETVTLITSVFFDGVIQPNHKGQNL